MSLKQSRQSNMELLRIIAMFLIVMVHANMYTGTFLSGTSQVVGKGIMNGIGNIGVTLFILISGYYGVTCKVTKLVRMECMMITFSLLETVLLVVFLPEEMQGAALLEQVAKSCLPFITRKYWFYSCYVCLVLLSGYIEKLLDALEQRELERLLVLLLVLFSVFPTLFYFEIIPDNGKGLVQMVMIYLIGRYIRRFRDVRLPQWTLVLFAALWVINGFSHEHALNIGEVHHYLCKDNSITNICMAVILFYLFKEWRFSSRVVNAVSAQMFAVFALNNTLTSIVMRRIGESGWQSPDGVGGFLIFLGVVVLILVACVVIGVVRNGLLGRVDTWLAERIDKGWRRLYGRIGRRLH